MAVGIDDVRAAYARIRRHVRRTPTLACEALSDRLGATVYLKCENLQVTGSFKARGASNAILSLPDDQAARGVVTHSSGNHAAAVAWAARLREIRASIVMPANSRKNKIEAVRRLGVDPVLCGPTAVEREAAANAILEETKGVLIHPYDAPQTVAGQGTAALELLEQVENLDTVVVPVGGGGLLSGTLTTIKSLRPEIRVLAAEPAWADDAYRSWKSGSIQQPVRTDTIADGLRTPLGQVTFPIIHKWVDDILLASEDSIASATRIMLEEAKIVVEPSGALPLAALLENRLDFRPERVALILSGGNLDFRDLPWTTT